jgi:hypothetical protein
MDSRRLPIAFTFSLLLAAVVADLATNALKAQQRPQRPSNVRILPPGPTAPAPNPTPSPTPPPPSSTPVPAEPPITDGVTNFACGSSGNQFWNNLVTSGYTIYSKPLRSAAEMQYWPAGVVSDPFGDRPAAVNLWSYDSTEDAALLAIPEYMGVAQFQITSALTPTTQTITVTNAGGGMDPGDHFYCAGSNEKFKWISGSLPNITVARGQRGSTPTAHPANVFCYRSNNSANADIRLPSPQSGASFMPPLNKDGDTYLIIWDNKIDESYRVGRSGMNLDVYKHVQLWSPSNLSNPGGPSLRWLEHRVGFCNGCAGQQPPDFNPAASSSHVAWLDFRCDGGGGGPASWSAQPGGRTLFGPNVYYNGSGAACYVNPVSNKQHFIVDANSWYRRMTEIRTQNNDYDLVSSWAKSETRGLVKLLDQMQASLRAPDGETNDAQRRMSVLQLEIDSSKQNLDGREVGSVLKQWFRNVWIGRNVPPNVRDQILACNVTR